MQLLRFSIDYLTPFWLGTFQPLLSYLDLSYYFRSVSPNAHDIVIMVCLGYINLYWIVHLIIFLTGRKLSNLSLNFKRLYFLLTKNLLFLPLLNSVYRYLSPHIVFLDQFPILSILFIVPQPLLLSLSQLYLCAFSFCCWWAKPTSILSS